jgi:hypothetical protein
MYFTMLEKSQMRKQSRSIEDKKHDFIKRTLNYLNYREKTDLQRFGLFYDLEFFDEINKDEIIKEVPTVKTSNHINNKF